MLRCDFRLLLKIERRPVKAAGFAVLRGSVDKELEPSAFWSHGCSGAQILIECFERFDLDAVLEAGDRAKAAFARSGNRPITIPCC
jgi:hypothetical protein